MYVHLVGVEILVVACWLVLVVESFSYHKRCQAADKLTVQESTRQSRLSSSSLGTQGDVLGHVPRYWEWIP